MSRREIGLVGLCLVQLFGIAASGADGAAIRRGTFLESFAGPLPDVPNLSSKVDYHLSPDKERYLIHVPTNYTGREPFGLVIFTFSGDTFEELPAGWDTVLSQKKLLFIAPQNAGNKQDIPRRYGLVVLGAMKMRESFKVDPERVYLAGYSGGARTAGQLAFHQSGLFHGTIQMCGADFPGPVPMVHATPPAAGEQAYGLMPGTPEEVEQAKRNVRFVIITGKKDFRYSNLLDLYEGGFCKSGFEAKLIDVPDMDHELCSAPVLGQAISYLDARKPAEKTAALATATGQRSEPDAPVTAAVIPVKPAWVSQEPRRWPQILLSHDARFRPNDSMTGASGFLSRLPNRAVVAVTARHLLGEKKALRDVDASIISWSMSPRNQPQRSVVLDRLALKIDQMGELDCVLMSVKPQRSWPVEVLEARTTPTQEGETLYLVGVPYSEDASQNVYRGVVLTREGEHDFAYRIEGKPEMRGFSGAPILDAQGRAVGIHLGHYNVKDGSNPLHGMDMSAAVEVADAPAPAGSKVAAAAAQVVPAAVRPKPVTRPSPGVDENTKASGLLSLAKNYIAAGQLEKARERLKSLVESYPATSAATEANRLLEEIGK